MILEEETYKKFGYKSDDLKEKSAKHIIVACDICGKIRNIRKFQYRALCRSCSQKSCETRKGKNSINWKGGKVKRKCQECGKVFKISPSAIKGTEGRFCSKLCKGKWQSKTYNNSTHPSWRGGKIKHICKSCKKIFYSYRKSALFCSRKCRHKARAKVKRICDQCGKEFKVHPSLIKKGYGKLCSVECKLKYQKGENNPNWKGGISFEPYCQKFNNEFKEYIRNKFGRICFLCQKTEEENGKKLSVHHVNYNKNCGCDDDGTCQFVPLCVACNSKVNNNRKEWEAKIKANMRNKLNGWYI